MTCRRFRLNAAVTPSASLYARSRRAVSLTRSTPSSRPSPSAIWPRNRRRNAGDLVVGMEVADGAAEKGDQAAAAGSQRGHVVLEVPDEAAGGQPRVLAGELGQRALERSPMDVEQDAPPQRAGLPHGVEQGAHLRADASSQLHQLLRPTRMTTLAAQRAEQRFLGPRLVVLVEPRDALEEPAAPVVVEVLAGEEGHGRHEARAHFIGHPGRGVIGDEGVARKGGLAHACPPYPPTLPHWLVRRGPGAGGVAAARGG